MVQRGVVMTKNFKIKLPEIPFDLEEGKEGDIFTKEELELSNCKISNSMISSKNFYPVMISKVIFKGVTFPSVSLERADLTDVIFENCDLSNVNLRQGSIHRVAFKDCKQELKKL